jgi:transcriptional regulator NrdR family protein
MSTDGRIVRRRNCLVCDARWYTVQEPEVHLPDEKIKYIGKYIKHRNIKEKIKILDEDSA